MKGQDQLNPAYSAVVERRTRGEERLDCLEQAADLLRRTCPTGGSCLDVGGASGYFFNAVIDHVGSYVCLDPVEAYLDIGRQHYAAHGDRVAHLRGTLADGDGLGPYDAVVCLGLFYTFPDFREPLAQLLQLSRRCVIVRALFEATGQTRYVPAMPESQNYCYYNIFSYGEVTEFALSRGWSVQWAEDRHRRAVGGEYQTAGMRFPFVFLVLAKEP